MDSDNLASHIDHTVLKPDARRADIEHACELARQLGCAGVCVNPIHVALASQLLEGSSVLVVVVAEIVVVPPEHPWTAIALADGAMLIHLAWPPEPGSATS